MRKSLLVGGALLTGLAFPAVASAHTAKATVDCGAITAHYTLFAPNSRGKTNTVHYKTVVDGVTTTDAFFVLDERGGREGTLTLPSAPADGRRHTVAFYTAWGSNGGTQTVDGHRAGSMSRPLASATLTCAAPPPPPKPSPTPSPTPTPTPSPAPPAPPAPPLPGPPAPASAVPVSAPIAPAAVPFPSVKRADRPADCVSTPKVFRVRAGQMNTIVMRVRVAGKDVAGARVKLSAPGLTRIKKTDGRGAVTFRIKPRRSGRLYVQSDQCAGADRVSVRAAKRASGTATPRFTG